MRKLAMFALVLALLSAARYSAAQSGNLIQNPGFESTAYSQVSADPVSPAIIFNAPYWWWGGVITGGAQPWINAHPSGYPHSAGYKRSGDFSFEMGRGGATYTAFLYQQVQNVPAGTKVHGSVWYYQNSGQGFVHVGIATDGNTFVDAPTIVWSDWQTTLRQWRELTVDATATASAVSLFFMATQPDPSDPNFTYWDDASLVITGSAPVTPGAPAPTTAPGAPAAPSVPVTGITFTTSYNLRLRTGPGTDFAAIATIPYNTVLDVVGRTSFNWLQVNYNGQSGWVAGNLGRLSTTLDKVPVTQ